MKKNSTNLSEITNKILRDRRVMFVFENMSGAASTVQSQVMTLGKELKAAGEDVTDEEVQAAILMAALDNKGKIEKVEPEDVEQIAQQIKESRGMQLNESALHVVEMVGNILGNAALLNVISSTVEKVTGKKMDPGKFKSALDKILKFIKGLTGFPAKVIEKFFAWISKLLGGGVGAQKIAGFSGLLVFVTIMLGIGIAFFPVLGGSALMIVLSITGLVGKGLEISHIIKELAEAIEEYKAEGGQDAEQLPKLATA
jgi:hypothetical protein